MIVIRIMTLAILSLGSLMCVAQSEQEIQSQYDHDILQEYLNSVYIPENMSDAMDQLNLLSDVSGQEKLKEAPVQVVADKLILGLGRWMMVNWSLYSGSRLSHHIRQYGVTMPEDQAKFLIVSYHRFLNEQPLNLEMRGKKWFELRKKEQEERNQKLLESHR